MPLESGTYISDLDTANPPQADTLTEAAGHLRLIKSTIAATFPNVSGAMTKTHTQLNTTVDTVEAAQFVPAGALLDFAGASAPTGYLLCYGQAISRTTYSGLFAAIGTTYGTGDGSTTFNVPDLRDRVRVGKGNMGGVDAGRINALLDTLTLGASYDAGDSQDSITILKANLPAEGISFSGSGSTSTDGSHSHSGATDTQGSHTHTYTRYGSQTGAQSGSSNTYNRASSTRTTSSAGAHAHNLVINAGGSHSHTVTVTGTTDNLGDGTAITVDILNPSIVVNVIIKT